MTLASNEERINVLTWIFVSEAGNRNRLSSEISGGKYTISQTNVGSRIKSQLIVKNLQESDEGSYYCQAEFSNGTALSRSQEINVFDRRAYTNYPSCNESRVEFSVTSRCVLFTSEVVQQPLPSTEASAASVTTSPATTTTGNGNGTQSEPTTDQSEQGEGQGGDDLSIANVMLYLAIGAVVFLVLVIILLVVCICLCNRACDCCQMCS